jgi:hypothetical protein
MLRFARRVMQKLLGGIIMILPVACRPAAAMQLWRRVGWLIIVLLVLRMIVWLKVSHILLGDYCHDLLCTVTIPYQRSFITKIFYHSNGRESFLAIFERELRGICHSLAWLGYGELFSMLSFFDY